MVAEQLNGDIELKKMIMKLIVVPLKVEPDKKNNCLHVNNEKGIRIVIQSSGIIFQKTETRAGNFPSIEILDVIDRIANYVKSV
jgi:hypothetical protein